MIDPQNLQETIPALESKLIVSVQMQDSNAEHSFNQLFSCYHDQAYGLVRKIVREQGSTKDHEEIVIDSFKKVWLDIKEYDPERASFKSWVNMKTQYTCLDFLRKRKRKEKGIRHESLDQVEEWIEPALISYEVGHIETRIFANEVWGMINQHCDETEIAILIMYIWHEKSFREIAEIVYLSQSTVIRRYEKMKRKIIELMMEGDG